MEPDPLRLSETLRERRRSAGLTRTRLAASSGVDAAVIARVERGEAVPTPEQARALRIALTGEDEPPTSLQDRISGADSTQATDDPIPPQGSKQASDDVSRPVPPGRNRSLRPAPPGFDPRPSPARSTPRTGGLVAPPPARAPTAAPATRGIDTAIHDPDYHVYSTAPTDYPTAEDRQLYLLRRIRTALILIALGVVLLWALGALQQGIVDVFDLFRASTTTVAPTLPPG